MCADMAVLQLNIYFDSARVIEIGCIPKNIRNVAEQS